MQTIWTIVLMQDEQGFEVAIEGNGGTAHVDGFQGGFQRAKGRHPDNAQQAYQNAEIQLLIKPAFFDR